MLRDRHRGRLRPRQCPPNSVPKLDVGPSCEAAAQGAGRDKQTCLSDENQAKEQVTENWSQYRDADKQLCAS